MHKLRVLLVALALPLAVGAIPLWSDGSAPWATGVSDPKDLTVKLVTIGPADAIYTWWGHSALIVEDTRLQTARFYNYGLFSFEQENFVLNFAMGRLWFQVGASDANRELAYYRYLKRSIHIQTLNLSAQKRLEMARFLEKNILPENRTYLYDHYYDNCATRVRDLIDRTVDGQLSAAADESGRMTLRQHTRRFTFHSSLMDWLLMFLMSDVIDGSIRQWEEMFLPVELESNVARLVYLDENGLQKPLVSDSLLFYDSEETRSIESSAPAHWPWTLAFGCVFAFLILALGFWQRSGAKAAWILYGSCSAAVALVIGLLGTVLFFLAIFTDHTVTYANENLFLANPLTLFIVPFGIITAIKKRAEPRVGRSVSLGWLQLLWMVLAGLGALYLVLKLVPAFNQENGLAVATIIPVLFGFAGSSLLSWRGRKKPRLIEFGGKPR